MDNNYTDHPKLTIDYSKLIRENEDSYVKIIGRMTDGDYDKLHKVIDMPGGLVLGMLTTTDKDGKKYFDTSLTGCLINDGISFIDIMNVCGNYNSEDDLDKIFDGVKNYLLENSTHGLMYDFDDEFRYIIKADDEIVCNMSAKDGFILNYRIEGCDDNLYFSKMFCSINEKLNDIDIEDLDIEFREGFAVVKKVPDSLDIKFKEGFPIIKRPPIDKYALIILYIDKRTVIEKNTIKTITICRKASMVLMKASNRISYEDEIMSIYKINKIYHDEKADSYMCKTDRISAICNGDRIEVVDDDSNVGVYYNTRQKYQASLLTPEDMYDECEHKHFTAVIYLDCWKIDDILNEKNDSTLLKTLTTYSADELVDAEGYKLFDAIDNSYNNISNFKDVLLDETNDYDEDIDGTKYAKDFLFRIF